MEASVLEALLNNLTDLMLPAPSWATHICDDSLVLVSVRVTGFTKVDLYKSVVITEDKERHLQVNTCMLQMPVVVPYLNYSIKNISELQSFLNHFDNVQICKYSLQNKHENCEIVGKNYCNICANCEAADAVEINPVCNTDNNNVFKCNKCSETFTSLEGMKCHAYVFHKSRLTYSFEPVVAEESAVNLETENLDYMCKICGSKWDSSKALREHELMHFNGSFTCMVCRERFNCFERLITHTKKYHPNVSFIKCHKCSKKFVAARYLRVHLRTHISEHQPLACSKCNLKFRSHLQLEVHEKFHKTTSSLHCKKCKRDFPNRQQLLVHQLTEHTKTVYTCKVCHQRFENQIFLLKHMQDHGVKSFRCNRCTKRFETYNEWLEHTAAHRSQKRYICPNCRKSFATRMAVDKHACNGKKYKCNVCSKEFDKVLIYKMHQRSHTMQKLFHCEFCKKSFSTKGNLAAHVRSHEKEDAGDDRSTVTVVSAVNENL